MHPLGRVLDPEELDRAAGPRGRLAIDVVDEWLAAGATVEIIVPSRLTCARCEGGGCDECGRGGAIRVTGDEPARTLRLALPGTGPAPSQVRLVRPLGDDAGVDQLLIELRPASAASAFCRRIALAPARAHGPAFAARGIVVVLVVLAVVLLALLGRLRAAFGLG